MRVGALDSCSRPPWRFPLRASRSARAPPAAATFVESENLGKIRIPAKSTGADQGISGASCCEVGSLPVTCLPYRLCLVGGPQLLAHVLCFSAGLAEHRQVLGPCQASPQIAHRVRAGGAHALQVAAIPAILPCAAQRARRSGGDVRESGARKSMGQRNKRPFRGPCLLLCALAVCSWHDMCLIPV